jgi:hypothetical protein
MGATSTASYAPKPPKSFSGKSAVSGKITAASTAPKIK